MFVFISWRWMQLQAEQLSVSSEVLFLVGVF